MISSYADTFLQLVFFTLEFKVCDSNVSDFFEHPFLYSDFLKFLKVLESGFNNGLVFFNSFFTKFNWDI